MASLQVSFKKKFRFVKFLNSFIKIHNIKHNPDKLRRKLNKYSICVVRVSEKDDGTIEIIYYIFLGGD